MPAMIRKEGKAEQVAHEILGTPINMPHKKYKASRRKEITQAQEQMHPLRPKTPEQVSPNSFYDSY
jgi:hypothetical protein